MHSEVIVSLIQGPRAKMFRCLGAQLYRGPEVSRGNQRCPEVPRDFQVMSRGAQRGPERCPGVVPTACAPPRRYFIKVQAHIL